MKSIILVLSLLAASVSFAGDKKDRSPAAAPVEVKDLAAKLKKEVRTRISAYSVSDEEANACSEAGTHYNVKVQVKKAIRALDKNGNVTVKYTWETAREVDTDASGTPMEICTE